MDRRKRTRDELGGSDSEDQSWPTRMRPMPTFFSVIRGALLAETIKSICASLEPVIRKAVRDEVQQLVCGRNPIYGYPQYFLEDPQPIPEEPRFESLPRHKLVFANQLPQSIFSGNNLIDHDNNHIRIRLIDISTGEICTNSEGPPIKVKIVAMDGEFPPSGQEEWTSDQFNKNVLGPREGKRPLLIGDTMVTLKNGVGYLGDMYFSDNSSWMKNGKFGLGAIVDQDSNNGVRIKEGLSEKFTVKDQRGELNKKHYPPCLQDETWRLVEISKDGKYHKRLEAKEINNVQDFLRMWFTNPNELQKDILKMKKTSWEKLMNHAIQCRMGDDSYLFKSEGYMIRFSPIGQILEASIGGICYDYNDLAPQYKAIVDSLASHAYKHWNQLEKVSTNLSPIENNLNFPNRSANVGYGNGGDLEMDTPSSSIGTRVFSTGPNLENANSFNSLFADLADFLKTDL